MGDNVSRNWLTKEEILSRTGVSDERLSGYIRMKLIPQPIIQELDERSSEAGKTSYFPFSVVDRILFVEGLRNVADFNDIIRMLRLIPLTGDEVDTWMDGSEPMEDMPAETDAFNSENGTGSSPLVFEHRDLLQAMKGAKPVSTRTLVNTLNYIHFSDGHVLAQLSHPQYTDTVVAKVCPEPSRGNSHLAFRWCEDNRQDVSLKNLRIVNLLVSCNKALILVPAETKKVDDQGFLIEMPEACYIIGERQAKRFACKGVVAELSQSGFLASGELLDMSLGGFRIRVKAEQAGSFKWFNTEEQAMLELRKNERVLFSGVCRYIRQHENFKGVEVVLSPAEQTIKRFKKRELRNIRQKLTPPPTVDFYHPFIGRRIRLEILDISTSGFAVLESSAEGILIQGMIIPELTICFSATLRLKCSAQVLYRQSDTEGEVRWGLAILDMDVNTYSRLTSILANSLDPHSYISSEIDMDSLWEFFFDSGLLYPEKYRRIEPYRKGFMKTCAKLYQDDTDVAKHFTYRRNGKIYGHVSMLRAYERTWMIHHHAAMPPETQRAGFNVLKQVLMYLKDIHRFPSAQTDYVMTYFRPGNSLSERLFRAFADKMNDPKACSTDLFYCHHYPTSGTEIQLPYEATIQRLSKAHFWDLSRFYSDKSGGLFLKVLGLRHQSSSGEALEHMFSSVGLTRKWRAYSLTVKGELSAVFVVDQSEPGMNLSELLNAIKVFVINPAKFSYKLLSQSVGLLASGYQTRKVPVLIYPEAYVHDQKIPSTRQYHLWVMDVRFTNEFIKFIHSQFKKAGK